MYPVTYKRISIYDPEFPGVWTLREEVLRRPLGLSLRDEDLSGEAEEQIIIAMQEGAVTGCVMLRPVSREELKLRQMAVAKDAQGTGIGAALIREAEAWAVENGFSRMTLHARQTAIPFYERCGYSGIGGIFEEVGIPHLLMQKRLL